MKPIALYIAPDGTVSAVADETAEAIAHTLGSTSKRRASHVVPKHPLKRLAFRLLRAVFSERGQVADWCRTWRGGWQVRFAATPHRVEFQHPSRHVCIDWEVKQLESKFAAQ